MQTRNYIDLPWHQTANVGPLEIDRFESLADEWWNLDGKFCVVRKFNEARLHFKLTSYRFKIFTEVKLFDNRS